MTDANRQELIRLVELDHKRTAEFINGVTTTGATIRGWAVTIWLAVLGIAFDRSVWELAALAAILAAVFAVIDGYHAWLYGEALAHANSLERVSAAYYDFLGRGEGDEDEAEDMVVRLETHRFGLYRNFKVFGVHDLLFVRPRVMFRVFYPALAVVGIAAALYIGLTGSNEKPTCSVIQGTKGLVVQCGQVTIVRGHSSSPKVTIETLPAVARAHRPRDIPSAPANLPFTRPAPS